MLRYKRIMSSETGYRDQMLARHDGQWVKHDEAQAEIARLKACADKWQAITVELGEELTIWVSETPDDEWHKGDSRDALANLQAMKGEME